MKNKKLRGESSTLITDDLIPDIISRVPAKDLIRFSCVSKSWCSLIFYDPLFARLQMERTALLDPFLFIEKVQPFDGSWLYYNYWIDLYSLIEDHSTNLEEIHNPFDDGHCPRQDAGVIGYCHGLFVLQQESLDLKMAVSNPTTRKHVMVPPNSTGVGSLEFCGFGYDSVNDCYKLVTKVFHRDLSLELMVYDLIKGGKWRSLQFGTWWKSQYEGLGDGGCYKKLDDYMVECVDGGVYWCIDMEETELREMRMMVCFLLAEEEFHMVKTPDFGEVKYYPTMTVLDERLGLVCKGLDRRNEVWSVQLDYEYGKRKRQWRWTKLLAILDPYATLPAHLNNTVLIPLCFSACRNKILIRVGQGQLFCYDIGKKEYRKLNNPVHSRGLVLSCVQSLVGVGIF